MAQKLNVEQPAQGQAQVLDMAAEAAAQEPPPVVGNPEAAAAIEQSAQEAGEQPAGETQVAQAPPPLPPSEEGEFPGITGILQAPGVMRQGTRTPYERDQYVAMMWDVVARDRGTALTQQIAHDLTGID